MPFAELFYHIVIGRESKDALHTVTAMLVDTKIEELVEELGGKLLAFKSLPGHVHLLAGIPVVASPDDFIREIKERTSELIAGLGRDEKLDWASGFGVVSVSASHIEIVKKYIESQEKRHAEDKLNATLERYEP
ncbi:MAG TPA: hypothetical protein ENN07_00460 [candidate division Zixibacteria bacterium]|nr:hypothetical protein [candidate division Zixibacteria bacterium]